MDKVVKRMTTDTCILSSYEEWDEGKDKKGYLHLLYVSSGSFLNIIKSTTYLYL